MARLAAHRVKALLSLLGCESSGPVIPNARKRNQSASQLLILAFFNTSASRIGASHHYSILIAFITITASQ